jgi:uncharacterized membrane protein YraQ (UPF0718 family)
MSILTGIADGMSLAARMAWETWWALVLGFTLSGLVEVFVSEERMTQLLGDDDWREIGLGTLFGAASSSCSYAATGMSKSVFKKGASGVASLGAFLFAATDLVIELGLVMWVLLGWQFVVGEYIGGVIATLVIALVFKHLVPKRWFDAAREHLNTVEETSCAACGMEATPTDDETVSIETPGGTKYFCCDGCRRAYESQSDMEADTETVSWTEKLFTAEGWDTAAKKTMKEWEMLWEDIALGFVLAGAIAAFVPESWWAALFGTEGTLAGVVVASVIAVLIASASFMCSVGNVPFALVLWQHGVPFGSVMSFIYGDLLIPPLINAYRRYYGRRMAAVMVGAMFVAAVVAGVSVHYLFSGLGLVPPTGEAGGTPPDTYIVVLNLVFTPVFLAEVYVAYGSERIVEFIRSLPETVRRVPGRAKRAACTARERLGDAGHTVWKALRRVGRASWLVGEAIWLVGQSVWLAGVAVYIVLRTPLRIAAAVARVVENTRQQVRRTLREARRLREEAASNVREARQLIFEPIRSAVRTVKDAYRS